MRTFGETLRNLRLSKKITMKELGKKINLTESAIGMYERNVRRPNYEKLEEIADFFNVDMDYLLGKSDVKNRYIFSKTNEKIKKILLDNNLSVEEFSQMINKPRQIVDEWLIGTKAPFWDDIKTISNKFNIPFEYLAGNDYKYFGNMYENTVFLDKSNEQYNVNIYNRPVVGYVQAGIPITALENIIDYEELDPKDYKNPEEYFGLKIKGDSMAPRILEGDVVIVHQQPTLESGDIGIILINGDEATCKRFILTDTGIMLLSLNPSYPPMQYSKEEVESLPIAIVGKVVELRGKF